MSSEYRNNHYVPEGYQRNFLPEVGEKKFYYLDLKPESINCGNGKIVKRKNLLRWGTDSCFAQQDLYTTFFGDQHSTEIEQFFFGKIDRNSVEAIRHFSNFTHPDSEGSGECFDEESFNNLLLFMSTMKMRTPKGLKFLQSELSHLERNKILFWMQEYQKMFCATWAECVWQIASAEQAETKFIISDHPVTVYNQRCSPGSADCKEILDPDVRLNATHTIFPLSLEKVLILTNLSWVRNPFSEHLTFRPNHGFFRPTLFNFLDIQIGRNLSDIEVNEINYIIKKRAYRYIAAAKKEWLYPESRIPKTGWFTLGNGHLLLPDPRQVRFFSKMIVGYSGGRTESYDEYGRMPFQRGYNDEARRRKESATFDAAKGAFAQKYGKKHRGWAHQGGRVITEDSDTMYQHHLDNIKRAPLSIRSLIKKNW